MPPEPLLTSDQLRQMLAAGVARAQGLPVDLPPLVKIYTPDANAVWLLAELDADGDLAYGLCDVGVGCPELGYVRLSHLSTMRGPQGLAVAVDKDFEPRQLLSAYTERALRDGSISD